jgi:hypothetical protein
MFSVAYKVNATFRPLALIFSILLQILFAPDFGYIDVVFVQSYYVAELAVRYRYPLHRLACQTLRCILQLLQRSGCEANYLANLDTFKIL